MPSASTNNLHVIPAPEESEKKTADLGEQLDDFATQLIEDVENAEVTDRIAAFKALSTFYIARTRLNGKVPADDEPSGLPAMRAAMKAAAAEGK